MGLSDPRKFESKRARETRLAAAITRTLRPAGRCRRHPVKTCTRIGSVPSTHPGPERQTRGDTTVKASDSSSQLQTQPTPSVWVFFVAATRRPGRTVSGSARLMMRKHDPTAALARDQAPRKAQRCGKVARGGVKTTRAAARQQRKSSPTAISNQGTTIRQGRLPLTPSERPTVTRHDEHAREEEKKIYIYISHSLRLREAGGRTAPMSLHQEKARGTWSRGMGDGG